MVTVANTEIIHGGGGNKMYTIRNLVLFNRIVL